VSITGTIVHRAEIRYREAADVLRPYVGCFWVVTANPHATLRVVPDGSTAISIQLAGDNTCRTAGWTLRGPLVRPDERRFQSAATLVGVRMRPGVAFLLSGVPAHRMLGRHITLAKAAPFSELIATRIASSEPEQYIVALERFLIARLRDAHVHEAVATAVREIERARGLARISDVVAHCGVSARHLSRLMRDWVGYGPKRFANILRFQSTLHAIEDAPSQAPAILASDKGYFDQAHLTKQLARFAGDTPRRLASTSVSDFSKTRCDDPS